MQLSSAVSQAISKRIKLQNGFEKTVKFYDFRSDTVTRPLLMHPQWKAAIAQASSEDTVMDPDGDVSTSRLESHIAKLTGKEASLFCASGTMSNQIACRVHLRGALQSVLMDSRSHIYRYENGGISYHSQAHTIPITVSGTGHDRHLTADLVEKHLQLDCHELHCPQTRLITLENTLNGSIMSLSNIMDIRKLLDSVNSEISDPADKLRLHLDGARLWNAAVETETSLDVWCKPFDSVSLCLSKGIGAPVGSVICGSHEFIRQARHYRKLFGGAWRQSGILAEMALQALNTTFTPHGDTDLSLLKQDHMNTRWLSENLKKTFPGIVVQNKSETNMLFLNMKNIKSDESTTNVENFIDAFDHVSNEMLMSGETESKCVLPRHGYSFDQSEDAKHCMRLVLHYQAPREACELLMKQFEKVVSIL